MIHQDHILILEDDRALCQGIVMTLQDEHLSFVQCHTLGEARKQLATQRFDLAVLDVNLPDGSGLELLKQIRTENRQMQVILLTANDMELDVVTGLELGADDYITKPFSLAILRARVNTQLRQHRGQVQAICLDEFVFDFERMEYYKGDAFIELSKTEQKLLRLLVENRGLTLSREKLIDRVWTDGAEYVDENALSVTIKRLRDKLEDQPSSPQYIKTVYGIGYTWVVR